MNITIQQILQECQQGNFTIAFVNSSFINEEALKLLDISDQMLTKENILELSNIIRIGNYTYNNTDSDVLPIDDGVYDLLVVKLLRVAPDLFTPGALPVENKDSNAKYKVDAAQPELIKPITIAPQEFRDWLDKDAIYPNLYYQDTPFRIYPPSTDTETGYITKRVRDTSHNYPELVGTLKKCKFVTDAQAKEKGVYDNPNVSILERDFFAPLFEAGILKYDQAIPMVATLKYDGVSVEADVNTEIISARTRGDTDLNKASDLTEILSGYKFPNAVELSEPIGMKFEAIVTHDDLKRMNQMYGTNYINGRTAIIGIFGSSEGRKYRDFITLVPLQCSIKGVTWNRIHEIEFLNKYYANKEYIRYQEFYAPFNTLLFQIKKFVEEAEYMRQYMSFMYDGIVVEFLDEYLRMRLGRKNSINQYAMAVKFNTLRRLTTFTGYTYTIGQNGQVTPMIHYNPVEFMGAIHTKTTGSSYARMRSLNLYVGDQIEVEYVNDVIPYVHTVHSKANEINHQRPPRVEELFPTHCPCCGAVLVIGDTATCPNLDCPERKNQRLSNMLSKLGINDFSDATVKQIGLNSFTQYMNMIPAQLEYLGPTNSVKLYNSLQNLKVNKLEDYRIVGALGFTNIAAKTWKLIFKEISMKDLIYLSASNLYSRIVSIKGCGEVTAHVILVERSYFMEDIKYIFDNNMYIATTGKEDTRSIIIRCTGFRDSELMDALNKDCRVDADDNAGVTKNTTILLIPMEGHKSSKVDKALKYGTKVVPVNDFLDNINLYIPNFKPEL